MSVQTLAPRTPITAKADRSDCRVRLLEEAILMLRGQWPSAATGLCMSVNSLYGFTLTGKQARRRMINESTAEALRLVEALYGRSAIAEVYRRATADHLDQGPTPRLTRPKRSATGSRFRPSPPATNPFHRGARLT